MEPTKDMLVLDLEDNEALKAALGGKEPGERCTLEVTLMVVANDGTTFEGKVEEVVSEDYSEDAEGEAEPEPEVEDETPVMVVVGAKRKK